MARKIGKYELQSEIGRGGFGTVHRAFDPTVGRVVAIKLLTASDDTTVLSRFRLEATAAGNLHHKNIITIYDFGQHEDMPYLVMEFLEGEDLQKAMNARRSFSVIEKMHIMCQVAEGLHCAHQHGVIHRDIKPANIMVLPDSTVKLMDFGIARMTDPDASRHTQSGFLVGTLLYMSPEQLGGGDATIGADIWAFGVILYELLAGVHPFGAPDMATIMYRIVSVEPESIQLLLPDCPEGLPNIVQRALSKDPNVRYQSLDDLKFDLEPVLLYLQKKQAQELAREAQALFQEQRWIDAQTLVRKILDLDPSNQEARQLRENLHKKVQIGPRVEALLKSGDEEFEKKNFEVALRSYESAMRLDQSDARIQVRVNEAQQAIAHSKKVLSLLKAARIELQSQNLTAALRYATESVETAPNDSQAIAVLRKIQDEVAKRQIEKVVQEGIGKARGLLMLDDYDAAIGVLTELAAEAPESGAVLQLLAQARTEKQARERREELGRDIENAKALVKNGQFTQASDFLKPLASKWPDNDELRRIAAYVEEQLAFERRVSVIDSARQKAQKFLEAENYQEAIRTLEEASQRYPGEGSLQKLLNSALTRMRAKEREEKVLALKTRCEELERSDRVSEALQQLDWLSPELKDDAALAALKSRLQKKWEQQQKSDAVRVVLARAQTLVATLEFSQALELLEDGCARYPDSTDLRSARSQSIRLKEESERKQFIEGELLRAKKSERLGDFTSALAVLESALARFQDDAGLAAEIERTRAAAEALKVAGEIGRERVRIEQLIASGPFPAAAQALAAAKQRFPGATAFKELDNRLQEAKKAQARVAAIARRTEEIQDRLQSGDFSGALGLIGKAQIEFPEEPSFAGLSQQIQAELEANRQQERQRDIDRRVRKINDAVGPGNYEVALKLISAAELAYPDEELFKKLAEEVKQKYKQSQIDQVRAEIARRKVAIEQAISDADFTQALEWITAAQAAYPQEAVFQQLLARLKQKQRESRQQEIERDIAQRKRGITEALGRGAFQDVFALIGAALQAHPGVEQFAELHREATRAQEAARSEERRQQVVGATAAIHKALGANDLGRAAELISSARSQFPEQLVFNSLLDDLNARVKARHIEESVAAIAASVEAKDFAKAAGLVKRALAVYPEEKQFRALSQSVARAQKHEDCLAEAAEELHKERFNGAEKAAREALKYASSAAAAHELLSRIEAARFRSQEQQQLQRIQNEIQKLNRSQAFDMAVERAQQGLTRFPNDAVLLEQLKLAEEGRLKLNPAPAEGRLQAGRKTRPFESQGTGTSLAGNTVAGQPRRLNRWIAGCAAAVLLAGGLYLILGKRTTATVPPELSTDVQELTFQFNTGEIPAAKTFSLKSDKPIQLTAAPDQKWLLVSPARPLSPAILEVKVDPAAVPAAAEYKGNIVIESPDFPNLKRTIPVQVSVTIPAIRPPEETHPAKSSETLMLSTQYVEFQYERGEPGVMQRQVEVLSSGKASIPFRVRQNRDGWLSATSAQRSTPGKVSLSIDPKALPAGEYSSHLTVFPADNPSAGGRIEVKLKVREAAVVAAPPKPPEPKPAEPKLPEPKFHERPYHGAMRGNISWTGNLFPGERLVFGPGGLVDGPGSSHGSNLPGGVRIQVSIDTPGIRQVEPDESNQYNKLVLVNGGSTPVTSIEGSWKVLK